MDKKIRIGIIFGGRSGEHEVSLRSAESVIQAIDTSRFDIVPIGITKEGKWITDTDPLLLLQKAADQRLLKNPPSHQSCLEKTAKTDGSSSNSDSALIPSDQVFKPVDVVFPVIHGPYGEDGSLQGLLEIAQVAYVGCGVLASSVAMDKILFKDVMVAHAIPIVPYLFFIRSEIEKNISGIIDSIESVFTYPVFCKPANLGSSVGITKCHTTTELMDGLKCAAKYDRRTLVEPAVANTREIEVAVLGNDHPSASIPGEIIPSREFYDYQSKYIDTGDAASRLLIPAPIPVETAERCRRYAVDAFKAIDGAGLARVDFLLNDNTGELFLNEINSIPGFTSISMYPKLWEATGITYKDLINRLIDLAVEKHQERSKTQIEYTPDF